MYTQVYCFLTVRSENGIGTLQEVFVHVHVQVGILLASIFYLYWLS